MAISYSTDFQAMADCGSQDFVFLVHIYTGESTYLRLATVPVVIGTAQYLACVQDVGTDSVTWKVDADNGVTLSSPTVTVNNYQLPNGYSIFDEFTSVSFAGRRIVILFGYAGLVLTDFVPQFDGLIDEPKIVGGSLQITTKSKDLPETMIAGRAIDYGAQKVGTSTITGAVIPEEVDGKRLPVPFGRHWNSPLVCYDQQDGGESSWCPRDNTWWAALANTDAGLLSHYRENLGTAYRRLLLEQEGKLVPYSPLNFNNEETFTHVLDTRTGAGNLPRVKLVATASCVTTFENGSLYVEVPLRLRYDAALGGTPPESGYPNTNPVNFLDGDTATYLEYSCTLGANPATRNMYAWLERVRQLCHGEDCVQIHTRPIHVTQSAYGEGEWQALWFGRLGRTSGTATDYIVWLKLEATVMGSPNRTAGKSRLYRRGNVQYSYYSNLAIRGDKAGWHLWDMVNDLPTTGDLANGISNTGNYESLGPEFVLPDLGREALDYRVKIHIVFTIDKWALGTGTVTARFWDLIYSAFQSVNVDFGEHLYAELVGATLTAGYSIYAAPAGWSPPYILYQPPQYIEAILRAKLAAGTGDFDTVEWGAAVTNFTNFFGATRNYSGFTLIDDIDFKQWFTEYMKDEPFVVYRDGKGMWRNRPVWKNLTDIAANETIHAVEFTDCDEFEIGLTDADKLCAEIKAMRTDFVWYDESYAQDYNYKLAEADYDYDFWRAGNTFADNNLFLDKLERKYTSLPHPLGRCTVSGVGYGAKRTCKGKTPSVDGYYWDLLAGTSTEWAAVSPAPTAYSADTTYLGPDAENRAVAEFRLNQWANRHRTIKFSSADVTYRKHEIGDYLCFQNVPYTLLGLVVKGFGGEEDEEYVAVNGQNVYYVFQVTNVTKVKGKTTVQCMQCHDLTAYRARQNGQNCFA